MGANICLKISFVCLQILVIIFGIILISLGVWVELQDQTFRDLVDQQEFVYGAYLLVAVGCAIILVSVIGLVGALCETKINKFLLGFYIILVFIILVAQLAGAILAFVFEERVESLTTDALNSTILSYNSTTVGNDTDLNSVTRAWDTVQEDFECCGIDGVRDWINRVPPLNPDRITYPKSCCTNQTSSACGEISGLNQGNVYNEGCRDRIVELVEENLIVLAAVGISFIVGQIAVILMAFCLLCFSDFDD